MSDWVWRSPPSCLYIRIRMPLPDANMSPELTRLPASQMPIVGIPACIRKIKERGIHTVSDTYPSALIDDAGCLRVCVPAGGAKPDLRALLDRIKGSLQIGSPSNVPPSHYGGTASHPE